MKKFKVKEPLIALLIIFCMLLLIGALSGCGTQLDDVKCVANNSTCDIYDLDEELNQTIIIVQYRNGYYEFEKGYYYSYKFTVEDTTNTFKYDIKTWFYSNEKWEIDDVVIVTEDNGELYFINIGNLNYTEE